MKNNKIVRRVAVLGAGVMGAQIAAHCTNAGIDTILFDLPSTGQNRNETVTKALKLLQTQKPAPLVDPQLATRITPANYDDDLALLSQCDLIIEAITENSQHKETLYQRISPYLNNDCILASNTSGLSINKLAAMLPEAVRDRFLGVHFFNPPRYMPLVELIPSNKTSADTLDFIETFLVDYLGKSIIRAKDTPNFIANRIGTFALLAALKYQAQYQLNYATVDALTGPLIGRPKSATFRTLDVVGLDTMSHVVNTLQTECKDDPWHAYFTLPKDYQALLDNGALGQKTKRGFYQKQQSLITVYDPNSNTYVESKANVSPELLALMKNGFNPNILKQLAESSDPQAQFLWHLFEDVYDYCLYHLPHIAHDAEDIDAAMKLGFGWSVGPFELWRMAGMDNAIASSNRASSTLPVYLQQQKPFTDKLFSNEHVTLWQTASKVAVLQCHSKNGVINPGLVLGMQQALPIAESIAVGLVLWHDSAQDFCRGADLKNVLRVITSGDSAEIETMVYEFQQAVRAFKYSPIPVVAALRGRALGGGCEILLHCDHIVAAYESYVGLVEIGVGLLPAGGGLMHGARRAAKLANGRAPFQELVPYAMQVLEGKVSGSAQEAIRFGYLPEDSTFIAHPEAVLFHAMNKAAAMAQNHYRPPFPASITVAGTGLDATIRSQLLNWLEGGFISADDFETAKTISHVITGGDLDPGETVDEEWFYRIERRLFTQLAMREHTAQRIRQLLHIQ